MLDLLSIFTEGLREDDASSSTPKARCDFLHLIKEQSLEDKSPSVVTDQAEIHWQKRPRVSNQSSVPKEITMFPLIIRKIPMVKSVRSQTQHEPGVE